MKKSTKKSARRAAFKFTKPQVARYSTTHEVSLDTQMPGMSGSLGSYRTTQEYAINPNILNFLGKAVRNQPDLPSQLMEIGIQFINAYTAINKDAYGMPYGVPGTMRNTVAGAAAGAKAGFDFGSILDSIRNSQHAGVGVENPAQNPPDPVAPPDPVTPSNDEHHGEPT